MSLSRIVMRLARNPGTEFSGGDDHRGYALTAPLTEDGPVDGRLNRRGARWFFDYDDADETDDEPLYRLGQHRFALGEYVTVTDEGGQPLTYKVMEVTPV